MALTSSRSTPRELAQDPFTSIGTTENIPAPDLARAPRLTLEICRGRTRFPQRPVTGPRFFIGSGTGCDLRLGGGLLPVVHSFIQTRGNEVWLEAVAADPPLLINGHVTRGEWLRDGDLLEIGPFQLLAHLIPVNSLFSQQVSATPISAACSPADECAEPPDAAECTAEQLVDLIEREQALVDEFEEGRKAGGVALMHAIRARQKRPQGVEMLPREMPQPELGRPRLSSAKTDTPETFPESTFKHASARHEVPREVFLQEIDGLCDALNELSLHLEGRSQKEDRREAAYAEAAAMLLEAQRSIKTQLEAVAQQVAALHGREAGGTDGNRQIEPHRPSRAIA